MADSYREPVSIAIVLVDLVGSSELKRHYAGTPHTWHVIYVLFIEWVLRSVPKGLTFVKYIGDEVMFIANEDNRVEGAAVQIVEEFIGTLFQNQSVLNQNAALLGFCISSSFNGLVNPMLNTFEAFTFIVIFICHKISEQLAVHLVKLRATLKGLPV